MGPACSALAMPVLLAVSLTAGLDVGLRTEVRATSAIEQQPASGELELSPRVAVDAKHGRGRFSASLEPQLVLRYDSASSHELFSRVELVGDLQASRTWRWGVQERFGYGQRRFSPAAAPLDASLQPLPTLAGLSYLQSVTTLGLEVTASRRAHLVGSLSYLVSGGADAASRAAMPLQHGPELRAGFSWALSRSDSLASTLAASMASFSSGQEIAVLELGEAWQKRLSRASNLRLAVGAGEALLQSRGASWEARTFPVAEAELAHRAPEGRAPLDLRLSARLGPFVDPLFARAYPRVEAAATGGWEARRDLRVYLLVSGAGSLDSGPARGDYGVFGEAGARWEAASGLGLALGVRGAVQRQALLSERPLPQWGGFVSALISEQVRSRAQGPASLRSRRP